MELETVDDAGPATQEACPICGSNDFYPDGGFYYCTLCNTQSQSARLYVDEDFRPEYQQARTNVAVLRGEKRKKESTQARQNYLSTWEIWNVVLKKMSDRLIEIGFPETVKAKVFNIYMSFLIKREVIFILNPNKKSRITLGEPKTNIYAFYNASKKKLKTRKKQVTKRQKAPLKKRRVNNDAPTTLVESAEDGEGISIAQKRKTTANKMKAMEKEYLTKAKDTPDVDEQEFENLISQEIQSRDKNQGSTSDTNRQQKSLRPAYTKLSRKFLGHLSNSKNPKSKFRVLKNGRYNNMAPIYNPLLFESFSLNQCLILVFVALRELGFPVVMTDVLRLYIVGILQIDNVKQLINDIDGYQNTNQPNVFVVLPMHRLTRIENLSGCIQDFVMYVGIKNFGYPVIKEIIPKYSDEFVLPREFECLLNLINSLFTFDDFADDVSGKVTLDQYRGLPEVIVLAQFVVTMKLLFGLDDKTEKYQSEFAKLVNTIVKKEVKNRNWQMEEWTELFVIEEWFGYLQRRRSLVNRELFGPLMYTPNNPPSMTKLQDMMKNCILDDNQNEDDSVTKTPIETAAQFCKNMFHTILKERVSGGDSQDIPKLKQYVPLPLPTESIVKQYVERYPLVADPVVKPELLMVNFIQKRIDFIWNPKKYKRLLKLHGYKVKVIRGDAINNFPTELSEKIAESKVVVLFQPYKNFDEFVGSFRDDCSYSIKLLLGLCEDLIPGLKTDNQTQPFLQKLVNAIGDMFIKRILAELLPVLTKWGESDSDSD